MAIQQSHGAEWQQLQAVHSRWLAGISRQVGQKFPRRVSREFISVSLLKYAVVCRTKCPKTPNLRFCPVNSRKARASTSEAQAEQFMLLGPFWRQISETCDADPARKASRDGGFHQTR